MSQPPQHPEDETVPTQLADSTPDAGTVGPLPVAVRMARPVAAGGVGVDDVRPPLCRAAWRPWIGLTGFFVCGALFVVSQFVGALVLMHVLGKENTLDRLGAIVVVGEVTCMALLPIGIVLVTGGTPARDLMLVRPRTGLLVALIPLVMIWPITSQVMSQYLGTIFPPDMKHGDLMEQLTQWNSGPEALIVIFQIALVPAVCEEILFRGLFLSALQRLLGVWPAVVIVGVVFAAVHVVTVVIGAPLAALGMMIPLTFLGLGLTVLAAQTGTIVYSSILHFANNLLALLLVNLFPEGAEHPWFRNGATMACLAVSAVAFMTWWLLLTERQPAVSPVAPVPATDEHEIGMS